MQSKRTIIFPTENNPTRSFNSFSTDKPQPKRIVSYFLEDGVSKKNHKKRKKKRENLRIQQKKIQLRNKFVRDGHTKCIICKNECHCGQCKESRNTFHLGHIIPASENGPTCFGNIVPTCKSCEDKIGNKNLFEFSKSIDKYWINVHNKFLKKNIFFKK